VCAAQDQGSVTSVGLSAPASDFVVGNSPITTSGTLNLAWKVAPTSASTPNAIVKRDASGNFAAQAINASFLSAGTIGTGGLFSATAAQNSTLVFAQNTATAGSGTYGVYGESDSNDTGAAGVFGFVPFGNGNNTTGVLGVSASPYGQGILGVNNAANAGPTFGGSAVEGLATGTGGAGVYGIGSSTSGLAPDSISGLAPAGVGVWGDTGVPNDFGVVGTSADGFAGWFENQSKSGRQTLTAVADNASSLSFMAYNRATSQFCYIDSQGNLNCTGAKHAVVPIDGGQRTVALSAIESPKNWFEDFGSAHLSGGIASVAFEADFAQTVNTGVEYHVFVTPKGKCEGLYVENETASGFEVHELHDGTSSVAFDYRIVALRKNFENIRLEDHTKDVNPARILHSRKAPARSVSAKGDVNQLIAHLKAMPQAHPVSEKKVK